MGGDGCKKKGLQLDVLEDQVTVHADAGGDSSFAVEISRRGEVVEGGFEGEFVVGS